MQEKIMAAEFDFDDFLSQAKLVANMGSLAGVAKMMPGIAGKVNSNQIQAAESRLKKNEAMVRSMTPKERRRPELLITDRTARSRLQRISKGSGSSLDDARAFMSEFQRMRTMMSRMSKMMGPGGVPNGMNPAMASPDGSDSTGMQPGNRAMRRASKSKKKSTRGGGGGFG